nr:MAG TPA: dimeris T4 recombination endonuclease VII [Caudoviricetes sp.]
MAKLLNNTSRVIAFGGIVLIPGVTAECTLRQNDLAQYPALLKLIDKKDVDAELDPEDAAEEVEAFEEVPEDVETEPDFEDMSVVQLKAYAKENGIDLGTAYKKAEIIAVLKG